MNSENYEIISFYKFTSINTISQLNDELIVICKKNNILGTVILSNEGINGMLAGSLKSIDKVIKFFEKLDLTRDDFKFSKSDIKPFNRLRIKKKDELISLEIGRAHV